MLKAIGIAVLFVGLAAATAGSIYLAARRDTLKTYASEKALPIVRGKVFWTAQANGVDPKVYLYVDGKEALEGKRAGDSQTFIIIWDSRTVSNGNHMLTMRSYIQGNKTGEESHEAIVRN